MRYFLFLFVICSAQTMAQTAFSDLVIKRIDKDAFSLAIVNSNSQLIDVRTPKEYSEGFIAQAQNIPIAKRKKFKQRVNLLDKQKAIYVYCYSGVRSRRASRILKRLGFTTIYDYRGGWKEWTNVAP